MTTAVSELAALQENADEAAALLHAVGNPKRLLILCLLLANEEMTVGQINESVDLSAPALSQHLARMRRAGLVACRRQGQSLRYRISDPNVARLIATLKELFCP